MHKAIGGLTSKDHMHHHPLKDLFQKTLKLPFIWNPLVNQSSEYSVNMHSRVTLSCFTYEVCHYI